MAIGRPISLTPNIATKAINSVATANQTDFTVTGGYRINELAVYRNGVRLAQGRDFTANDGTTVTLTNGATVNDVIEFVVFDSFNVADAIVSVASSQTVTGDLNVTGKFYSGSIDPNSLNAGVGTFNTQIHVGSALTADASGNLNTVGVVTATSFSGSGANLTGLATTETVRTDTLTVAGVSTFTGASNFSAAVNVDATTDSTSSSTGALIVDGGVGIAKNVYIGAGLSVAGTLTYEDVTNVDSVGMVTAKSGVNISGGQLQVGTAYSVGAAGVVTAQNVTISAGTIDLKNSGSVSNIKFYCESSNAHYTALQSAAHSAYGGNVTLTLPTTTDTLVARTTTDTLTNKTLTSPTLTTPVFSGQATGELKVGSGVTIAATSGVATFADGGASSNALKFGSGGDLIIYHDGSNSMIDNNTGNLNIQSDGTIYLTSAAGSEVYAQFSKDGAASLRYDNSTKLATTSSGVSVTGSVGVGTDSPNFSSFGSSTSGIEISDVDTNNGLLVQSGTNEFYFANTPSSNYIHGEASAPIEVATDSTARLTIGSGGDIDIYGTAAGVSSVTWDASANSLVFKDSSYAKFGDSSDLSIYHSGSSSWIYENGTGPLYLGTNNSNIEINGGGSANDTMAKFKSTEGVELYYNNSKKFETTNDGVNITGIATFSQGCDFNGLLREKHNQVDAKLSAGVNIDLEDGMVHYYSVNETTTATPNIRYNSSKSLNNMMTIGETVTVTIIYKPNGAGYYAALEVDGSGVTEEWNGGSAPSSANSSGYDILTHTLLKVADASFLCFSNVQNYA